MKTAIALRLLRLNREFYDTFAADFANSRRTLQPGIVRALDGLGAFESVVDVGCGDGRVGLALAGGVAGHRVSRYLGVDYSEGLLRQASPGMPPGFRFMLCDLTSVDWPNQARRGRAEEAPFDAAVCFSALHHVPGARRRLRLLRGIRSLLEPGSRCAVSVWQFLHAPRLRRKIVPWSEVDLRPEDVDAGDYLLDWRRGGRGLRYVHHFDEPELTRLCRRAGFRPLDVYRSDGHAPALSRSPDPDSERSEEEGEGAAEGSGRGEMGLYILLQVVIY